MDHKLGRKAMIVCDIIGLVLILLSLLLLTTSSAGLVLMIAGLAVIIAGAIVGDAYMRCPRCRGRLYYRGSTKHKFCPHCGKPIEW